MKGAVMQNRINEVLDGDRDATGLSSAQRDELASREAAIERAAGALRSVEAPDLTARVMARVAEEERARAVREADSDWVRRFLEWVWRPRPVTVSLRPAYAL
jgi:hypothetical protein